MRNWVWLSNGASEGWTRNLCDSGGADYGSGRRGSLTGLRDDALYHTPAHPAPMVWRAPERPAAVPVGGSRAWPAPHSTTGPTGAEGAGGTGGHGRASRRGAERSEAASPRGRPDQAGPLTATSLARLEADAGPAGPGRASRQRAKPHASTPGTAGVEGAGGTCRSAGGRWRGLAGLRADAPSEARGTDGERAGRRPPAHTAAGPSGARKTSGTTSNNARPRHRQRKRAAAHRAAARSRN